jgi:uncharacterized protein (TIRG00374 family)
LKYKKKLINISKILFVILLLTWLIWSGKLDFRQLNVLFKRPDILIANVFIWLVCSLFVGGFRWFLLLRGQGLHVKYGQVLKLQLIGFFFNTAIPGAVGGDIIKAVYVIRGLHSDRKTPAMLTILLDRIFGLCALFFLGTAAVIFNPQLFISNQLLFPLALFVVCGSCAILIGLIWVLYLSDKIKIFKNFSSPKFPGSKILEGIFSAVKVYKTCPRYIIYAILLGIFIQFCSVTNACFLTEALTGIFPNFNSFMAIFTVGIMTTALPLAPGGLGVGHVAFEKLFLLIGLSNGANVFNVMVLVQLMLNLIGFIPYLSFKSHSLIKNETLQEFSPNTSETLTQTCK